MRKQVTLKPGDYIATAGISEETYHVVAKSFIEAGAGLGEYPNIEKSRIEDYFGWSLLAGSLRHSYISNDPSFTGGRALTPAQVIGATKSCSTANLVEALNIESQEDKVIINYIVIMPDGDRIFVNADNWEADEEGLRFERKGKTVAWFTSWHGFFDNSR